MANFITENVNYYGKENQEVVYDPIFIGESPLNTKGIKIMRGIVSKTRMNMIAAAKKVTKKYVKGFNAATGAQYTQRDIDVYLAKAEMAQDAHEFYETVFEVALGKGVDWNDVEKATPIIKEIVVSVFTRAIESDLYRQFWLNDVKKEKLSSTTFGNYNGVADTDYDIYDGMWTRLFANSAVTPSATQFKAFDINCGAVNHVQTGTITGTSGTANVNINGINYLATFDTDLNTTASNFVTLHAAALLLRKGTLTYPAASATFVHTALVPGEPQQVITITNLTGDLAGSVAQTTANTAPADLTADQILGVLRTMYAKAPNTLKAFPKMQRVILMDSDSFENLLTTYEGKTSSAALFSSEMGRQDLIRGVSGLKFRGIDIVEHQWREYLDVDFPHASGANPARYARIIYTVDGNLVMAIDDVSEFSKFEAWYNKDEQENRVRNQYKAGTNYVHEELSCVAYEI